ANAEIIEDLKQRVRNATRNSIGSNTNTHVRTHTHAHTRTKSTAFPRSSISVSRFLNGGVLTGACAVCPEADIAFRDSVSSLVPRYCVMTLLSIPGAWRAAEEGGGGCGADARRGGAPRPRRAEARDKQALPVPCAPPFLFPPPHYPQLTTPFHRSRLA